MIVNVVGHEMLSRTAAAAHREANAASTTAAVVSAVPHGAHDTTESSSKRWSRKSLKKEPIPDGSHFAEYGMDVSHDSDDSWDLAPSHMYDKAVDDDKSGMDGMKGGSTNSSIAEDDMGWGLDEASLEDFEVDLNALVVPQPVSSLRVTSSSAAAPPRVITSADYIAKYVERVVVDFFEGGSMPEVRTGRSRLLQ